ncbi:MAG: histidinol-phosphatase [Saprospiraceae bacterium]|nr:histidinol-phosphatase [Saprospiraceae bacterium]
MPVDTLLKQLYIIQPLGLLFVILLFLGCHGQPTVENRWYKGNLHTHSFWSDGDDFPEMIMEWYKDRGYNFLALTDHNIVAEGEKWIGMAEDTLYRNAFARYLTKYGEEWVNYKEDSGRLSVQLKTLAEYRPLFEEKEQFLVIQSEEITNRFENKHLHLNATHLQQVIEPQGGSSVVEVLQKSIDAVRKMREETGIPTMVHINHPNFHYSISLEDMIALEGEQFFEVFNGHHQVHNQGDSAHIGTEEMWDQVNLAYLQKGKPLIYGLATDDSHHYHRRGREWSNAGRGWVMVQADSLAPDALIKAMEKGDFYASTGVSLSELSFRNHKISITVDEQPDVNYEIVFIGARKDGNVISELSKVNGGQASFKVTSDLWFVRVKIISDKTHSNPIENINYEMAWTQPFLISD